MMNIDFDSLPAVIGALATLVIAVTGLVRACRQPVAAEDLAGHTAAPVADVGSITR